MFLRLHSRRTRTVLLGFAACSLIFGGAQFVSAASPLLATAPSLGAATSFGVLGASTVTNTGPSTIRGDLGVYPGSAVTGFPPGLIIGGALHTADGVASQAQAAATTAYNALAAQTCDLDLTGKDLGTQVLGPGVYCFSSSAQLTGTLTLNATGNGVFIFQIGSTLTTAPNAHVQLNGGSPCNVFWQVGSSAIVDTTTTFVGNIIALASITLKTGAIVSGRALARTAAVTLDTNDIGTTACVTGVPSPTPGVPSPTPGPPTSTPGPSKPAPVPTANVPKPAPPAPAAATSVPVAAATPTTPPPATLPPTEVPTAIPTATVPPPTATPVPVVNAATNNAPAPEAGVAPAAEAGMAPAPEAGAGPAPNQPVSTPIAVVGPPSSRLPPTLPRTGSGLPPLGLVSLVLGGLAVLGAVTLRRPRK